MTVSRLAGHTLPNEGRPDVLGEPDMGWGHFGHCPLADSVAGLEECVCDQIEVDEAEKATAGR